MLLAGSGVAMQPAVATTAVGQTSQTGLPIATTGANMGTYAIPGGRHDGTIPGPQLVHEMPFFMFCSVQCHCTSF